MHRPDSGRRRRRLVAALAAALAFGGAARAETDPAGPEALARAGNCQAALPLFAERRAAAPDASAAMLEIQCLIRLRRYAEAEPLLRDHVARNPAPGEAWLYLGMARFHLGDIPGAGLALDQVGPEWDGRPEHRLYRGLVMLSRGEALAAAAELELVREGTAAPVAGYWAGVAWLRAGERERGRAALQRVTVEAPESPWSLQAQRALESGAEGGTEIGHPWWTRVTVGYEYDDNVVLRAGDVPLAREVSSQRDTRYGWRFEAGREWWRSGAWTSGTWLSYTGTDHDDLSSLDVHLPTVGAWLDRRIGERTLLRMTYDYGYAWVDDESFLQSHGLTPAIVRSFGRLGAAQIFARGYAYDYRGNDVDVPDGIGATLSQCPTLTLICGARGVDEEGTRDRDGFGVATGLLHTVPSTLLGSQVSLGYTYFRYWAEGREQSYEGHEVRLTTRTPLPFSLLLRLDATYAYRPYRHASSVPEPYALFLNREYPTRSFHRRDQVARVEVGLERPITDRARIGILYSFLDNDSNYGLFEYDRQIVGTYVTIGFGPGRWIR
jgi:tetratricopeptide (TPR) repeat protein